jgi:hypothetical protein
MKDSDIIQITESDELDVSPYDVVQVAISLAKARRLRIKAAADITNLYQEALSLLIQAQNIIERHR